MRVIGRLLGGAALLAVVLGLAAFLFRGPLAGAGLRWALLRAGVENPALKVDKFSLSQLRIVDLRGGAEPAAPAIDVKTIDIAYSLPRLLTDRTVTAISVGPGRLAASIDEKGRLSIAGAHFDMGAGKGKTGGAFSAPFDRLEIKNIEIAARAPQGDLSGAASGAFSMETGGAFTLDAKTPVMAAAGWRAENAALDASVELEGDGRAAAKAHLAGDFISPEGEARGTQLAIKLEGASWRDALKGAFEKAAGAAHVDLQIADIPAKANPLLEGFASLADGNAAPIESFSAQGALIFSLENGAVKVSAGGGDPLRIAADRGDVFLIRPLDGAPLYQRDGSDQRAALSASIKGDALNGDAHLKARSQGENGWTYEAAGALGEETLAGVSLGATQFSLTGDLAGETAAAQMELETLVRKAAINVLRVTDAPLSASLHVNADFGARRLFVSTEDGGCLALDSAHFQIVGQDADARLDKARLCGGEGPLVSLYWTDPPRAQLAGVLTAKSARYRTGATLFDGAPPRIEFEGAYDQAQGAATLDGSISDGRLVLNKAIIASNADGSFSLHADESGASGEARLASIRLSQNASPVMVAPVIAAGTARLTTNGRFDFDFTAATPSGRALGAGKGGHVLSNGRGDVEFHSGELSFTPNGLQPATLIPALKGVIGESAGATTGDVRVEWGPRPQDFQSSGDFVLRDVSFAGPGRAVSKTAGVTGELKLSSFAPLKSEGPQTLTIGLVDLDALKLENGTAHFELPGDDSLQIIDAEFPWFGGAIGAYDTRVELSGAKTVTQLRAEKVDLAQILEFVNVDGLSGEGVLSGKLPIEFENGKARIVNGVLSSVGPGAIRYTGSMADAAASAGGDNTEVAFSILRDLQFKTLTVTINGPLDGQIQFQCDFNGVGPVPRGDTVASLPVKYGIHIQANFLELLQQARTTMDVKQQIERAKAQKASDKENEKN